MRKYIISILFISICLGNRPNYFQQHIAYDIEVTLDDSAHTLDAYEKIIYTNNSPDTLDFIWFHIWPNAYKNTETAFAKQRERFLNTSFIFSEEKKRGYIDSLNFTVDGIKTDWEYHPDWIDVAKVELPKSLPPGNVVSIETPFFVKLPKVFSRLGHTGKHYEITQWYPKPAVYDHLGWHPMPYLDMGEFYSEFGSFDVRITLPEEYRIMATGDLVNGEAEYAWLDSLAQEGESLHALDKKAFKKAIKKMKKSGKKKGNKKNILQKLKSKSKKEKKEIETPRLKTLHFHQDNVHDFAWFADPKWIVRKGTLFLADSSHQVKLWSMYDPKNAELWENSIEYLHDSGYWYSVFNGDYPYNHITAVDGDMSAGGGMEYPNITVISKMDSKHLLEMVIMHEVGHNWFYGILGSNERDHTWMDEGLNEFCNIRYWDKKYGKNGMLYVVNELTQEKLGPFSVGKNIQYGFFEYIGYTSWVKRGDEEPLETSANDFRQRTNYWLSYSKPLVYTWHLLDFLGEETIDSIFHNYYEDWKFRHPYPADYFSYFSQYSDKDLDWYTHDVFYKTGRVDYAASIQKGEAVFRNNGTLTLPFEAAFYDKKGTEISRHWYENVKKVRRVTLPKGAESVKIDPDRTLPDINQSNNATSKPLTLTWVFDQPQYDKWEIFWMPWVFSWNEYNGWSPGINFYHGFVPGYDYGVGFRPMWDFNNEKLVGSVSASNTVYGLGSYYMSTFSFDAGRNAGRAGFHIEFEGKRKENLERYPVWTTIFKIDYHDISENAVDSDYYDSGELATGYAEMELYNRPNPFLTYYFRSALKMGIVKSQFLRVNLQTNIYYKFTKKLKAKLRIWIGGFLDSTNIPKQYFTFLSGNIDPDFRNRYLINRTADINDVSIGLRQYDIAGPSLHGLVINKNGKMLGVDNWVISANYEMNISKIPGKPFMDVAIIPGGESYFDFGLKKSFGPLSIIIPLYQSWDDTPIGTDTDLILDRLRFSLTLSDFDARSIF